MTRQSAANLHRLNSQLVHLAKEDEAKVNTTPKKNEFYLIFNQQNQQNTWTFLGCWSRKKEWAPYIVAIWRWESSYCYWCADWPNHSSGDFNPSNDWNAGITTWRHHRNAARFRELALVKYFYGSSQNQQLENHCWKDGSEWRHK